MKRVIMTLILFFLCPSAYSFALIAPSAKLTAKVVSVDGEPIVSARVQVFFMVNKKSGWGMDNVIVKGGANKEGLFSAKGSGAPLVGITVDKDGYYQSNTSYEYQKRSLLNRWEPWNPTVEVVLKKKRNPVPMYAQSTDYIKIPVTGSQVGFDLEKGDWVAPYGAGVMSDLVINFQISRRGEVNDYACSLEITLPNEKDGIQEFTPDPEDQSYFKWPFNAPKSGYVKTIIKERSNEPTVGFMTNVKDDTNYIYRVRTKVDEHGNIISAKYGKIKGDFVFDVAGNFRLKYFYNPDGTRNLEFDPEQNLIKWSSRRDEQKHRIREP